jgi:hypothetical protein
MSEETTKPRVVATQISTGPMSPIFPDSGLLEQDVIAKVNAGAMLTFAVWSLPKDVVSELFKNAPQAFHKAYGAATEAYGVGGR